MGLNFLNPAALLGLGLLALPVLAHLTGYREVRRVDFPTLRFLQSSSLKVRRRRRMESLLLLLLRCAAVGALVLLFSRPVFSWKASALSGVDPAVPTVILLDTSASMSSLLDGQSLFERARSEALELLEGLDSSTQVGLIRFDSRPRLLGAGITTERTGIRRDLETMQRSDGSTDLAAALRRGRDALVDAGVSEGNLFVLSDGTASVSPTSIKEDWPSGYQVHYHDLLSASRSNRWVEKLRVDRGGQRGSGLQIGARLAEAGAVSDRVGITLTLPGEMEVVREVGSEEQEDAEVLFSLPVPPEGAVPGILRLSEDDLPADDVCPFVLDSDSTLDVLLVSGDGGTNPREDEVYYLERALEPGAGSGSRVRPRVVSAEQVRRIDGGAGSVVFLANVANPGPLVPDLLRLVEEGGGLFVSVGANVDAETYNEVMEDLLPSRFTELKTRGRGTFETAPVGLSIPRMDDEEFRVFRSGGSRGFSRVGFGKVWGVEPRLVGDSRVLLRYSDGLPALVERRVGAGRVVLFTSSLDDDWTDLPLRSIYVPLMHQFARGLSGSLLFEGSPELEVGSSLRLPVAPDDGVNAWVQTPDGSEIALDPAAADGEGRVRFEETGLSGHYSLFWDGASGADAQLKGRFSVRVPQTESRLSPVDPAQLMAAVPGLVFHQGENSVTDSSGGEVVRRASLVPSLLGLLALLLLCEALLAGRRM